MTEVVTSVFNYLMYFLSFPKENFDDDPKTSTCRQNEYVQHQ